MLAAYCGSIMISNLMPQSQVALRWIVVLFGLIIEWVEPLFILYGLAIDEYQPKLPC
jgi:hypothetical protein